MEDPFKQPLPCIMQYDAVVTDNQDPTGQGRIRVACAGIQGDEETQLPVWIRSTMPHGMFSIPNIGQQIRITMTQDPTKDSFESQSTIGLDTLSWDGQESRSAPNVTSPQTASMYMVGKNYAQRRGWTSPAGNGFIVDDTQGDQEFMLLLQGDDGNTFIRFETDGSIVMNNPAQQLFYMNAGDRETTLANGNSHFIGMNSAGTVIASPGDIRVVSSETTRVSAKAFEIEAALGVMDIVPMVDALASLKAIPTFDQYLNVLMGAAQTTHASVVTGSAPTPIADPGTIYMIGMLFTVLQAGYANKIPIPGL